MKISVAENPHISFRRRLLRAVALAATLPLAVSLVACSSPEAGGSSDEKRSLTFVFNGSAAQQEQRDIIFEEFREQNPDIDLKTQGIASATDAEYANTVATRIAGGQQLDVIQIATEGQSFFASKGLLEPLASYIEEDQDAVDDYFDDIDPNLIKWTKKYSSTDNTLNYMPGEYNTVVLYVNKELFQEAGVDIPAEGWTWEEFKAAGEKIKAATGAYLYPVDPSYFTGVMPWLTTNGASTINEEWDTATFDSPAAIEAAEFARSLVEAGLSPKPGGTFDVATAMSQGKLATFSGGRWPTLDLRRLEIVEQTQIVPFPVKVQNGSPVGWDAWGMMQSSKNKEDAWTLIKFLMSKEAGVLSASSAQTAVTPRISIATSDTFLTDSPQGTEALVEALSYATPIPAPERGPEVEQLINEAWASIMTGASPAKEALTVANKKIQALL